MDTSDESIPIKDNLRVSYEVKGAGPLMILELKVGSIEYAKIIPRCLVQDKPAFDFYIGKKIHELRKRTI